MGPEIGPPGCLLLREGWGTGEAGIPSGTRTKF